MITSSSRYTRNQVVPVTDAAGLTRPTILPRTPVPTVYRVQYYTWGQYDRVDLLARRFYGDETLWWLFAEANPEIANWMFVARGTVIRVPNVA